MSVAGRVKFSSRGHVALRALAVLIYGDAPRVLSNFPPRAAPPDPEFRPWPMS